MPINPAVAFLAGAAIAVIVAGLVAALLLARARIADLAQRVDRLEQELANLERVRRNKLYTESLEDQRARQLRAAADVATGGEFMIQAIRILNPELLKKDKR